MASKYSIEVFEKITKLVDLSEDEHDALIDMFIDRPDVRNLRTDEIVRRGSLTYIPSVRIKLAMLVIEAVNGFDMSVEEIKWRFNELAWAFEEAVRCRGGVRRSSMSHQEHELVNNVHRGSMRLIGFDQLFEERKKALLELINFSKGFKYKREYKEAENAPKY